MGWLIYSTVPTPATLILIFAVTFIAGGLHLIYGIDLKGLGWLCVIFGIADACYTGYFAITGMPIFALFAAYWFIVYALFALWCLTGKAMVNTLDTGVYSTHSLHY